VTATIRSFVAGQQVRFLSEYRAEWHTGIIRIIGRKYVYVIDDTNGAEHRFFPHQLQIWQAVSSLYVGCAFPMRDDAIAASDTCQKTANSAVMIDGNYYYRCPKHAGRKNARHAGYNIHTHVWRRP
jgi:hypothetical protein